MGYSVFPGSLFRNGSGGSRVSLKDAVIQSHLHMCTTEPSCQQSHYPELATKMLKCKQSYCSRTDCRTAVFIRGQKGESSRRGDTSGNSLGHRTASQMFSSHLHHEGVILTPVVTSHNDRKL